LLDSIVADELFTHFRFFLTEKQHGFFKGRSTVTNLLGYTEQLQQCLGSGGQLDVIYTDFSKAFDRVNHNILLVKLQKLGVNGKLLDWFGSYLKGRSLRVQIGNTFSDPVDVTSSVVQGSHCGPILFSLFINDIADLLPTDFNCYADDLKLFFAINSAMDCALLQEALNRLSAFALENDLALNVSKCFVVSFTKRKKRQIIHNYYIDSLPLSRQVKAKDLGVSYNSSGSFSDHIDQVCLRARRALGFVIRNSKEFTNVKTIKTLYCSLVRSLLEYSSQVWNPTGVTQIKQLETIQHKFLLFVAKKFFGDYGSINYSHYENVLKIQTLELRRCIADVKLVVKSFNGEVDSSTFLHHFGLRVPRLSARSQTQSVFNVPLLPTVISRLMKNFNQYCNDLDKLAQSSKSSSLVSIIVEKFSNTV